MNHSEIISFLWGVADLIRDTFKRGKYQDVTLPLTVLRRLDCVLANTKEKVLGKQAELRGKKLVNVVVRPVFFQRQRFTLMQEPFLIVDGTLQRRDGTIAVRAGRIRPLPHRFPEVPSHDFH